MLYPKRPENKKMRYLATSFLASLLLILMCLSNLSAVETATTKTDKNPIPKLITSYTETTVPKTDKNVAIESLTSHIDQRSLQEDSIEDNFRNHIPKKDYVPNIINKKEAKKDSSLIIIISIGGIFALLFGVWIFQIIWSFIVDYKFRA